MEERQIGRVRELLQVLARNLGGMQKECVRSYAVTFSHSHVIYEVQRRPGISLGELAAVLGLDDSTASRHVKALVAQGLLEATIAAGDRRHLLLRLTGAGEELYQQIAASMESYIRDLLAQVPPGRREQVVENLEMIIAAMGKIPLCRRAGTREAGAPGRRTGPVVGRGEHANRASRIPGEGGSGNG